MKTDFNGKRLNLARLYRGISAEGLGSCLGVDRKYILNMELGLDNPSSEQMFNIVRELRFPSKFYFSGDIDVKHGYLFFRHMDRVNSEDRHRYNQGIKLLVKTFEILSNMIIFPRQNMMQDPSEILDVEVLATRLRDHWQLGNKPVPSMLKLLEENGALITRVSGLDSVFTIFQDKINGCFRPLIVLGDDKPSAVRRNFNLAHEIGHYYYDSLELESNINEVERRADDFAGAFLLPKEGFLDDILHDPTNIYTYLDIKKKWNVSIASMMVRAYKLQVIHHKELLSLQSTYRRLKWGAMEPYDDEIVRCAPYILNAAVKQILEGLTVDELLGELSNLGLSMYPEDIENILDLDKGTLSINNVKLSIYKEKI